MAQEELAFRQPAHSFTVSRRIQIAVLLAPIRSSDPLDTGPADEALANRHNGESNDVRAAARTDHPNHCGVSIM
jgi:hypothetical protein